jgi:hypothetical protein
VVSQGGYERPAVAARIDPQLKRRVRDAEIARGLSRRVERILGAGVRRFERLQPIGAGGSRRESPFLGCRFAAAGATP